MTTAGISAATLKKVERAAGGLATRAVALMDERLTWFRTLPADQRSWVTLVAQAGIGGYVPWLRDQHATQRLTDSVFGTAPRQLLRAVSLRRTVELVRVAIDVAEEHVPALALDAAEADALRKSLLSYSREIAFAAAAVYAAAAETRGAWDARAEAALVDAVIRGESPNTLASRAAALNWDSGSTIVAMVGPPPALSAGAVAAVADWARTSRIAAVAAVQGDRLIVLVPIRDHSMDRAPADAPTLPPEELVDVFGAGTVVVGPPGPGLTGAVRSTAEALAALRAVVAWPGAPRHVSADALLSERALDGDPTAVERMRTSIYHPLVAAPPLLATLDGYLAHGAALEPAARSLFIHPNTLRYRLRRIADITGRDPWNSRDVTTLRTALIVGRLAESTQDNGGNL